jgi:hypothetical protein
MDGWYPPGWLILAFYFAGALVAYAGALAAVGAVLRWRLDSAAATTTRLLAVALPPSMGAAVGATMLFAWSQGFSTEQAVVVADVVLPAALLAAAAAGVRLYAVSRARGATRGLHGEAALP